MDGWMVVAGAFLAVFTAYGIGANDVANAFGSSVGAKAITLKQAVLIAAVCEFSGATLMGSAVVDTISKGIANTDAFSSTPDVLMYGMLCVLFATGLWLLAATYLELPVSTTHSVVGGVIGMAVAANGWGAVRWAGVGRIALSWVTSPALAGGVAAGAFAVLRAGVLRQPDSLRRSYWVLPPLVWVTFFVITWFVMAEAGKAYGLDALPWWATLATAMGVGCIAAAVALLLVLPRMRERIGHGARGGLKLSDLPRPRPVGAGASFSPLVNQEEEGEEEEEQGLLPLSEPVAGGGAGEGPPAVLPLSTAAGASNGTRSAAAANNPGGRAGGGDEEQGAGVAMVQLHSHERCGNEERGGDVAMVQLHSHERCSGIDGAAAAAEAAPALPGHRAGGSSGRGSGGGKGGGEEGNVWPLEGQPAGGRVASSGGGSGGGGGGGGVFGRLRAGASRGVNFDIHGCVQEDAGVGAVHDNAEEFDPATEDSFKYLQVFTAMANSFAHGSNDVANAIGPFAAIWTIYESGGSVEQQSRCPPWVLLLGGAGLVLGLATYGYNIMRALGVKMAKLTNSRGFVVELSAAAVIIAGSRVGLPLSTTHCMVGGVAAIGMLEGVAGVNWRLVARVALGWVATLFVCGLTSGALFAWGAYAPSLRCSGQLADCSAGVRQQAAALAGALQRAAEESAAAVGNGTTAVGGGSATLEAALRDVLAALETLSPNP